MQKQNKSLSKGLIVLKQIMASTKPLTANILCQKLQIDKSTMSRLITTLMNEEFIEYKANTKEIILSNILKKIIYKDDREKIVEKTSALLDEIFYLTEECSYIGVFDNNSVLYLNQIDKSKRVLKTRNSVGLHAPIHTNGFGKAILAFKEDINLETIELKKFTSNTITSITKLKKELELIKERGYAIGNEEHEFGLCSVAVPYFNKRGEFVGTVGVSGLTVRMDEQKLHEYGQKIFKLVNPYA
ncbi:IclR family transcriptional regulator [Malaciobacter marinus]|uniref:IclR family transcriptional regulator n=1 Tax=Malaciobacter marinus TaxID=505249 RepID=UPI001011BF96|nr:IclR family transcriptional regulator [Malaciobacter halophilus]RYA22209.1 IclR family transcriptional regulator [Malaciobacter halophilus]